MATLQKIRNRAGVLIAVVIGIALLAFILGDFMKSGKVAFSRSQMTIAKINGESIYVQEYDALVKSVSNFFQLYYGQSYTNDQATEQARFQAWDELLNIYINQKEYDKIGLAVHPEELFELISGKDPHPIIRQFFTNQETNTVDSQAIIRFLKAVQSGEVDEKQKELWYFLEKEIDKDRIRTKFNYLFNKGIYTTNLEAKHRFAETSKKVAFSYVSKSVTSVPDSLIQINSNDISEYYKENINLFQNKEETREIEYVMYEVVPSKEDDMEAQKWINDIHEEFANIPSTEQYVNANSDSPYDPVNYTKEELPEQYRDILFDAPEGTVYGPYYENNAYKLAKLAKINYLPDSVRARHILLAANQNTDYNALKVKADSLLELVKKGIPFGPLAETNWDDKASAADGGDLGWFTEGKMVKPFNDTCFYGKTGDIKIVNSQFGIHIVEITNQSRKAKKVQIGVMVKKVLPSSHTIQSYYTQAVKFAGENTSLEKFNATIKNNPEILSKKATDIKKSEASIPGLANSRPLVQWAYQADVGDVSQKVFEINNDFIIVTLTKINKKGPKPLDEVENEIKASVLTNKKIDRLMTQMSEAASGVNDINVLADKLNSNVVDAGEVFFGNPYLMVREAGVQPAVVALATITDEGKIAGPVKGNNGVYVIQVNSITIGKEPNQTDLYFTKMQMNTNKGLRNEAQEALKEMSDITDNRANFF